MKHYDFSGLDAQEADSRNTQKSATSYGSNSQRVLDTSVFGAVEAIKFLPNKVYTIRFVPYEVDATHPKVMQGKMKAGQAAYVLDYTQHAIGPNKTLVLCPKGTFGKSCPICDKYFDLKQDDPNSEEAKSLKSSRRVMYNVVVVNSTDEKCEKDPTKVRLIQASQFLFESPLLDELKKGDGDTIDAFHISDLCVGSDGENKALKIMTKEEKKGEYSFVKFDFQIVNNKVELDDDALLEQAVPLHKALITLDETELQSIMFGVEPETHPEPVADDDEEEDLIPPVMTKKTVREEEDAAPVKTSGKCPSGHTWATDCGFEDECDDCPLYAECRAAKKALRAENN